VQNAGLTCWRAGSCGCEPLSGRLCVFRHGPEAICRWSFVGFVPFRVGLRPFTSELLDGF